MTTSARDPTDRPDRDGESPEAEVEVRLDGSVRDPGRCREVLEAWLPDGEDRDVVVLVASELVTNAVLHGSGDRCLRARSDGGTVRIGVVDQSAGHPTPRSPDPHEPTGRGLWVVERLSRDWGVTSDDGGKEVWAVVQLRPDT